MTKCIFLRFRTFLNVIPITHVRISYIKTYTFCKIILVFKLYLPITDTYIWMNFRRILSKSSSRSSSSGKSLILSEEVCKLQSEIDSLKQTIETLKISLESRDAAVGTLAGEKEKLFVELKSVQRTNRNLQQQLIDERDMNAKERKYLIEEIKRLSRSNPDQINIMQGIPDEECIHSWWKEELKHKDEVIYNVCVKYLKIKSSKQELLKQMENLQFQSQKICEHVIYLLRDNRKTLDNVLRELIEVAKSSQSTKSLTKSFLKQLKTNSNLHYENTQLKVFISLNMLHEITELYNDSSRKMKTVATLTKSERKSCKEPHKVSKKINRHRSLHSQILNHNFEATKNFSQVHESCSPYFSRKNRFRSESEPCLFSSVIQE